MGLWRPNPSAEGSVVSFWGRSCACGKSFVLGAHLSFSAHRLNPHKVWSRVPATYVAGVSGEVTTLVLACMEKAAMLTVAISRYRLPC